jgi:hypothetical protein
MTKGENLAANGISLQQLTAQAHDMITFTLRGPQ